MLSFTANMKTKIYFGKGEIKRLEKELVKYKSVLLAYGGGSIKKIGLYDEIIEIFKKLNIKYFELSGIKPNPRLSSVYEGIDLCKKHNIDFILGAGGGSVIDCIKAVASGSCYNGDIWDVFQRKGKITKALPLGAVLNLSATGSEMNGGSVITKEDTNEKLSAISDLCKPKFSILDPTYTFSVSKYQTAAGSVDIMSHLLEQYFSPTEDIFLQERIGEALIKTVIHFAPIALREPENYYARAQLMWSSSLALNGLTSFGLYGDWSTHFIEHELSGFYDITHGAGLAIITPAWMKHVLENATDFQLKKLSLFARNIWDIKEDDDRTAAEKGIEALEKFIKSLNMPLKLSEAGIDKAKISLMAESAVRFGEIGGFKRLNKEMVEDILIRAF